MKTIKKITAILCLAFMTMAFSSKENNTILDDDYLYFYAFNSRTKTLVISNIFQCSELISKRDLSNKITIMKYLQLKHNVNLKISEIEISRNSLEPLLRNNRNSKFVMARNPKMGGDYKYLEINVNCKDLSTLNKKVQSSASNNVSVTVTQGGKVLYKGDADKQPDARLSDSNKLIILNSTKVQTYPELIKIKGGTFTMGTDSGYWSSPKHRVTLSDYYIGKTEVIVAQFRAYCDATGASMPKRWGDSENDPVQNVSWHDAVKYCNWLSKKLNKNITLPTEAQWEFAARGGNKSKGYIYAGSNYYNAVGWVSENALNKPHPVASKKANELGLFDMCGNVGEWCLDWFDITYYERSPSTNPVNKKPGNERVHRGGYFTRNNGQATVDSRFKNRPDVNAYYIGFRVAAF